MHSKRASDRAQVKSRGECARVSMEFFDVVGLIGLGIACSSKRAERNFLEHQFMQKYADYIQALAFHDALSRISHM